MPEQIDKAIEKFGFAMGPFRMHDLAGNDVSWRSRKRRYVERPEIPHSRFLIGFAKWDASGRKPAPAGTTTSPETVTPIPRPPSMS